MPTHVGAVFGASVIVYFALLVAVFTTQPRGDKNGANQRTLLTPMMSQRCIRPIIVAVVLMTILAAGLVGMVSCPSLYLSVRLATCTCSVNASGGKREK